MVPLDRFMYSAAAKAKNLSTHCSQTSFFLGGGAGYGVPQVGGSLKHIYAATTPDTYIARQR